MSFENQKWSENAPEVISEGQKFKNFLGAMSPDPLQSALPRTVSLPQILPKYYFAPLAHFLNEALITALPDAHKS